MSGAGFFSAYRKPEGGLRNSIFRRTFSQGPPDSAFNHQSIGLVLFTIIGINAAVFGTWKYAQANKDRKLGAWLTANATCSWRNIDAGRYYTLLTAAFSHYDTTHFIFNMFALHAFGSILRVVPGVRAAHLMALVLGSGVTASAAWLDHVREKSNAQRDKSSWWSRNVNRVQHVYTSLGASGVVMGLGAAATCLVPLAPMQLMFIPVNIPLFVITAGYAAIDLYYLDSGTSRVGHSAHLGGLAFGGVFYLVYLRRFGGIWHMLARGSRR